MRDKSKDRSRRGGRKNGALLSVSIYCVARGAGLIEVVWVFVAFGRCRVTGRCTPVRWGSLLGLGADGGSCSMTMGYWALPVVNIGIEGEVDTIAYGKLGNRTGLYVSCKWLADMAADWRQAACGRRSVQNGMKLRRCRRIVRHVLAFLGRVKLLERVVEATDENCDCSGPRVLDFAAGTLMCTMRLSRDRVPSYGWRQCIVVLFGSELGVRGRCRQFIDIDQSLDCSCSLAG